MRWGMSALAVFCRKEINPNVNRLTLSIIICLGSLSPMECFGQCTYDLNGNRVCADGPPPPPIQESPPPPPVQEICRSHNEGPGLVDPSLELNSRCHCEAEHQNAAVRLDDGRIHGPAPVLRQNNISIINLGRELGRQR